MIITAKQIENIAQEIEMGMKVYINRETLEIKPIYDWEDSLGDVDIWEEEEEAIEEEWANFSVISKMESWEAFQVMEDFLGEIQDKKLQQDLVQILERKRPFANFKAVVETSAYREKWFNFQSIASQKYVKKQLEAEGFETENCSISSE